MSEAKVKALRKDIEASKVRLRKAKVAKLESEEVIHKERMAIYRMRREIIDLGDIPDKDDI